MNEEKGGEGDDSHASDSCFPGELVITTLVRFAGAQHENTKRNNAAMEALENAATAAWVKGYRAAKNRL